MKPIVVEAGIPLRKKGGHAGMSGVIGFLINLQFFTVFSNKEAASDGEEIYSPCHSNLSISRSFARRDIGRSFCMHLWNGPHCHRFRLPFSFGFLTMALTGGLHLDGWIDASDAFFSYQDKERRLEIMKDSRTGAFGVISVIVLLAARFLFIYEIVERVNEWTYFLIIALPLLSKCVMGYLLIRMPLAEKRRARCFFFKVQ
ncbi:adenosylcobinamide-GDP ribazoletransferase [Peribacillus frigoritolerans]|nr:adenosylcobinamide-GDP ribazoletransferase [Peribacillus frigoritolerans]